MVGFHGGGFLSFSLGAISLQPEFLISTQGARIDSVNGSYDWKVTYAAVPVMFKYRSAGGFYLEAGPQFSFKLSDNVENQTIDDFANDLDLSAGAGLGLQTKGGLGIGARYLVGISKVGDFDISERNGIDPDFKNSVFQVGLSCAGKINYTVNHILPVIVDSEYTKLKIEPVATLLSIKSLPALHTGYGIIILFAFDIDDFVNTLLFPDWYPAL